MRSPTATSSRQLCSPTSGSRHEEQLRPGRAKCLASHPSPTGPESSSIRPNRAGETMTSWQPNERYPDPAVRVLDKDFLKYRLALASVERLYTGCRWAEGPVYFGDGPYLLSSDIPNNRVLRWTTQPGPSPTFPNPPNNAHPHPPPPQAPHLR